MTIWGDWVENFREKSELDICSEEAQFGREMSYKPAKEAASPVAWPSRSMDGADGLSLQEPLNSPCKS